MAAPTTALLVIDMQKEMSQMLPNPLSNVIKLSHHFQFHSMPRIFIQHGHTPEELTPPYPNQLVKKWGVENSLARGSAMWDFIPEIGQLVDSTCPRIDKSSYDAFINTDLDEVLKEKKIERVVICGVMTDCCCDATGKSAFNRGYETWMVGDACGTDTVELHEAALEAFGRPYGDVITTDEAMKRLS